MKKFIFFMLSLLPLFFFCAITTEADGSVLVVCLEQLSGSQILGQNCSNSKTIFENMKNGYKVVSTEPYEQSRDSFTVGGSRNKFWIFIQK